MASKSAVPGNIVSRSPWLVQVRFQPKLSKQFPYARLKDAQAYLAALDARAIQSKLTQLETSFQLRLRRARVKTQNITFDTLELARQAMLKMESDLSVSIVRDYARATQTTLCELQGGNYWMLVTP